MDLWIRSQDREKLVKCNDIVVNDDCIIGYFDKDTEYEDLGTYKTKERALEVLDEIQNAILGIISLEDKKKKKIKQYTGVACLSKVTNCLVYEMPKA